MVVQSVELTKKYVQQRCNLTYENLLSAIVRFPRDQYLLWLHPSQMYYVSGSVSHRNLSGSGVNTAVTLRPIVLHRNEYHNTIKSNTNDAFTSNLVY